MATPSLMRRRSFNARERNTLFVNGRGRRFIEAGYALGVDTDLEDRGVAVADLDQDGALDLLVRAVARQKLTYLHNELAGHARALRVDLRGTRSNRDALGAVVRLRAGALRQVRVKTAGSGFQSQSEGTLHFGLGTAVLVEELLVRWPSGLEERYTNLPADRLVTLVEGAGRAQITALRGARQGLARSRSGPAARGSQR